MAGYVKLFGSILQSTVWEMPTATRCVWITMLAMSDMDGVVSSSIPGLARMAGVSRAECEDALAAFLAPDPDSRTKEHEGRRIEAMDGGWKLLNHAKYRAMQTREERREKDAERKRRARAEDDEKPADDCGQMRTDTDSPQNSAPSRSVTPSDQKHLHLKADPGIREEVVGRPTVVGETAKPSAPKAAEPALLVFPCDGKVSDWRLTASDVEKWQGLFPALDVLGECRAAYAWVEATKARRKTAAGMPTFLVNWFTRTQNRGTGRATPPAGTPARASPGYAPLTESKDYTAGMELFAKETA